MLFLVVQVAVGNPWVEGIQLRSGAARLHRPLQPKSRGTRPRRLGEEGQGGRPLEGRDEGEVPRCHARI